MCLLFENLLFISLWGFNDPKYLVPQGAALINLRSDDGWCNFMQWLMNMRKLMLGQSRSGGFSCFTSAHQKNDPECLLFLDLCECFFFIIIILSTD